VAASYPDLAGIWRYDQDQVLDDKTAIRMSHVASDGTPALHGTWTAIRHFVIYTATFNELFLRDRATTLSKMVGEIPDNMCYGAQDIPGDYMKQATSNLTQGARSLRGVAANVSDLENALDPGKPLAALPDRSYRGSPDAASAAALSGVFVESMRGVVGAPASGTGRLTSPPGEVDLMKFGKEKADKIGKEVARERNEDPLYPDPAR
jgi:hypothetical protein